MGRKETLLWVMHREEEEERVVLLLQGEEFGIETETGVGEGGLQ